jgi:hypothetical protein
MLHPAAYAVARRIAVRRTADDRAIAITFAGAPAVA